MKILEVKTTQRQYPMIIGTNVIKNIEDFLKSVGITTNRKLLLIIDEQIEKLYGEKVRKLLSNHNIFSYVVSQGENSKSLSQIDKIITYAIENGLDRSSVIIALGGGMVGDLAGFAAAIYMRGIEFVQIPTTILAHDSSIGGKVGVNHSLGKNMIGAFHQPRLVVYDTSFLKTLPIKEVKSGLAELIKHGLIKDKEFVEWLVKYSLELTQLRVDYLDEALYRGSKIKAEVVYEDEHELGIRAILNFGHTFGHVIESISNYQYSHGEGVAIGMIYAARIANKMGLISYDLVEQYIALLQKFGLPTTIPSNYQATEMLAIMLRDKKFEQDQIKMVLPTEIGKVEIVKGISKELLLKVMEDVKG